MEGNEKAKAALAANMSARDATPATTIEETPVEAPMTNGDVKEDVGSDVDELESVGDSAEGDASNASATPSRQASLREKALRKKVEETAKAAATPPPGKKGKAKQSPVKEDAASRKQRIDDGLVSCDQQDDLLDRDFRRHKEVMRIRPIGKDRFFNQYWFFDGVGTMDLFDEQGRPVYHTGRLFIQAPTEEDWRLAVDLNAGRTEEALIQRMQREISSTDILRTGDWASLSTEAEVSLTRLFLHYLTPESLKRSALG